MKIELYGNRELVHRGKLELHTGEIHIWKIQWRELETFWKRYNSLLEKEECQKTEHYRFYEDQMRYLAGKIAVRILLKEYSGVDKIVLGKGKYGKLYWKAPPGQKEITFSLSHSGEWVLAVFAYLCQHPNIKEAAVVGVPDEVLGNRICAYVMLEVEKQVDLREIHRFLKSIGVAFYKLPDQVESIDFWPLTSVGKIDKKVLVERATKKEREI